MIRATRVSVAIAVAGLIMGPVLAGTVNGLTTFTAGTPAKAAEVNGNFTAVKAAVDDNQAQITALLARVSVLEAKLTNLAALNSYLSLQTVNGQPTVRVTGANLQVVNGAGTTDSINGVGNLIVGYDEASGSFVRTGLTFDVSAASKAGSHNIVVGSAHAYPSVGGLVAGWGNRIEGKFSVAAGGALNVAPGDYAASSGGARNKATGVFGSVTGGRENTALDSYSVVTGGKSNLASGNSSVVTGGDSNSSSGFESVVVGGSFNQARAEATTVGGGQNNIADDIYGVVSGGKDRFTNAVSEWVGGPYRGQ
jgi:hypothetical protein